MGRERQKKKNRSSVSKVKPKLNNRTKAGRRKVNFLGNETIAKNWDRKLTVSQNFRRLGLANKLGVITGGTERRKTDVQANESTSEDPFAIPSAKKSAQLVPQEVSVERDPKTGRIIKVVRNEDDSNPNPLNDPLNDVADTPNQPVSSKPTNDVVAQLEAEAEQEAEWVANKRRPRQQSEREQEWVAKLVEKYGDNTRAMVRDRKLNPMQQTEADISRRIRKWKASQNSED